MTVFLVHWEQFSWTFPRNHIDFRNVQPKNLSALQDNFWLEYEWSVIKKKFYYGSKLTLQYRKFEQTVLANGMSATQVQIKYNATRSTCSSHYSRSARVNCYTMYTVSKVFKNNFIKSNFLINKSIIQTTSTNGHFIPRPPPPKIYKSDKKQLMWCKIYRADCTFQSNH